MTEAIWGDEVKTPPINWRMSAALEDVPRGGGDVAEVTNLEEAVRAWSRLDPAHQQAAILRVEHPIQIEGVAMQSFNGGGIAALVERLPRAAV